LTLEKCKILLFPEEILADDSVDTILIATRHDLHGTLVEKALTAGKHIFVEKPLSTNAEQLQEIIKSYTSLTSKGTSPILMVGFNRRFSPFIQETQQLLLKRSTPLVASYSINAGFVPKTSWIQDPIQGGGRIIGEVCHFVDTLRFLVGAPVRTVQASSIQTDDKNQTNRDSVAVTLNYADGSLATIMYHALGNEKYPKERLEIAAGGTVVVIDDYRRLDFFGTKRQKIKSKQDKGFDSELKAFVKALKDGGPAPIPFAELVETTRVTFAIHEALNTGQPVNLAGEQLTTSKILSVTSPGS
jgi:polar amino acid transport system substrate-binding protein